MSPEINQTSISLPAQNAHRIIILVLAFLKNVNSCEFTLETF